MLGAVFQFDDALVSDGEVITVSGIALVVVRDPTTHRPCTVAGGESLRFVATGAPGELLVASIFATYYDSFNADRFHNCHYPP
jgi:hypothetical protein